MRPVGGDNGSAAAAAPESDSENAWDGEPRVIYSNVLARVEHLKCLRNREPFSRLKRRGGDGDGGRTEGSTSAGDSAAPSSERRRKNENSRQKWERQEDDRRFVEMVLDREEYHASRSPLPNITVVDASGRERRMSFRRQELEPLEVGSVVVVKEARSGAGLAAYLVGEEETQTFIVGNGVACAPTLLTQELHHASDHGEKDGSVGRSKLEGYFAGMGGGGVNGGKAEDRGESDGESHGKGEGETAEIRARALGLRYKALRRLLRSGEESRTPHELFRQAADMGDAESYFYLALLQSTGLHGEEPGAGKAQARTWALCSADAFNTNSYLLLAHRFHKGIGEAQQCTEAVNFYQQAVYGLREGREDISQDVFPSPEAFRLGGEHGFGGWGLDVGEIEGIGAQGSGGGAEFSWTEGNGDGIGGGIGGFGVGEGAVLEAWPVDAGLDADVFLGAEDGFPRAIMLLGYLHIIGSERMAIKVNYAKAEELLWKAARQGEPAAYSYLAWMHHNGYIGEHLPPHLQPPLPPGGSDPAIAKSWPGPRTEEEMKQMALKIWGEETLAATSWGKGKVSKGGGSGWRWGGWGARRGDAKEGFPLKEGEDIWRGEESLETWDWEVIEGGVSGAIAAADLYVKGFQASDPLSGTSLADMWLHSEYTDSRDGRGAGGKWSMVQAYLLFQEALKMGRKQQEPQTIAALRLGTMLEYGLVPYLGVNMTMALEYYKESADSGGMDALIALAELNMYGHGDVVKTSCEAAARFYKMYTDLCIKDTFLAAGRIAFMQKRYQEAFFNYLIAAELGNKEGQASLAWLLDKAMSSPSFSSRPDARSLLYKFVPETVASLLPSSMVDPDSSRTKPLEKGVFGRKSDLEGVIENVRGMGGDAGEMASGYRRRAAEQGDADSRCEIADDLYRQAKAMGAVPAGTGLLPWVNGRKSDDLEGASAEKGKGEVSDQGEVFRLARVGDAMRLLDEAVEQYRLSCEAERGGSKRGLFSMGWFHQHGVGVDLDRDLARDYYRRSASAPAVLGLWLMETSDVIADVGTPLAFSAALIAATVFVVKLLKGVPRRRQRRRGTGGVGGRISMDGDGANASPGEGGRGATTATRC